MPNKKGMFELSDLEVQSFVTTLNLKDGQTNAIQGGAASSDDPLTSVVTSVATSVVTSVVTTITTNTFVIGCDPE